MPTNAVSSIYDPFPQAYSSVQEEFMLSQTHGIRPESRRKMLYKETISKTEGEETAPSAQIIHREKIVTMLENHYCAHPLRPGYASGPASREGIRESRWSSSRMYLYSYCKNKSGLASRKNGTKGRWELWDRQLTI